jgi:hypothetical protein
MDEIVISRRKGVTLAGWQRWPASRLKKALKSVISALFCTPVLAFCASNASAQGCAMCYQNAAASGAAGRPTLRHGILVLLVPAIGLFVGIFVLLRRRSTPPR